ncbi:adenylate/guanylate cyclase domain-containing protein [Sneathiella marina]|uniref:Adenylate/guanylate cyclase domain-containing protein n=1 Tax=Sneathiella marina TaxID=2950108 RepID=A0ABY4VZ24_9PROT|nr:adenylate/guanylate cyclase domain-containing protein [Sneathiella marina]USG60171.1 adenylate/guanylate cyclase domain-containing protein [Sneathiella marina]
MTVQISESNPSRARPALTIDNETLQNEIRIEQSVQVQANMPVISFGSFGLILLVFYIYWDYALQSGAIYLLIALLLSTLLPMRGYFRLRGKPRPAKVSIRRIRVLEIYTLTVGLLWAATIFILLAVTDPVDGVILLWVMYVTAYTGAFLNSTMVRVAAGFAGPVALANAIGAYIYDVIDAELLLFLCLCGLPTLAWIIWLNGKETKINVRLRVENRLAELERRRVLEVISTQLGKYMSPQLYQSIFRGEQKVEIASKRKKLTVFFSDIAGFTEITDQLESEELTALLNHYLTEMSKIALEHGATIDKFIGDAIVVYFGDPETKGVKEDAAACVHMAIAMQKRLKDLQIGWQDQGLIERPFAIRIGINTGYCTVGNIGSEERMDYTIIGNEVNLAARLETASDIGGILLANETYSLVKEWLQAEEQAAITVKGFQKPIRTFRVTGALDDATAGSSSLPGFSLDLDTEKMSDSDKQSAVQKLRKAIAEIEEPLS